MNLKVGSNDGLAYRRKSLGHRYQVCIDAADDHNWLLRRHCVFLKKGCYETSGAQATAVKPHRKKINIHFKLVFELAGAALNSCQTKTPQQAEIMVAPCPIEYETAGPTMWAWEATKLAIPPVHHSAPPST